MGIVKREGVKSSIVIYVGFAIGALNVLYFFPHFFSAEEFGLTRVLLAASTTFAQFAMLGSVTVMIKFFPFYRDYLDKKRNDFLFIYTLIPTLGFILVGAFIYLFRDKILIKYVARSPLFVEYAYLVYVTAFFLVLYNVLETYCINLFKTVLPNFFRELGIRIFAFILIILFVFKIVNFKEFTILYSLYFLAAFIGLLIYLKKEGLIMFAVSFSRVTKRLSKQMFSYGAFVFMGGVLYVVAENIDTMMIAGISGLKSTAIFAVASYVTQIIQVPQKSVKNITYPILAKAWKERDMKTIGDLYRKTSVTQYVLASFLFILIWTNIDLLFAYLPDEYIAGKQVVLIMSIAKIIDMATGINAEILETSNFWKINFLLYVGLIALSIPLNYILIYQYGIVGSAISNLIALTAYNVMRFVFIWRKFNLQPFSLKTVKVTLLAMGLIGLSGLINFHPNFILLYLIKTGAIAIVFIILIYKMKISPDLNSFGVNILRNLFKSDVR
jgi:O-antigen/teichoic acid export membrane protein